MKKAKQSIDATGESGSPEAGYSGPEYWETYHEIGIGRVSNREAKQDKWLNPLIPVLREHRSVRVLDLGCGSGYDALALAQSGFTVSGCDISQVAVDHAQEQAKQAGLSIDYRQHDIARPLPYPDGSFDAVICNLTLHMFPVEVATVIVAQVRRCLAPSGLFLFHVNSSDDLPYRSKLQPPVVPLGNDMYRLGSGQTMRFYSERDCRDLLEGWDILEIEPVQMLRADGGVQKCAWRCIGRKR